MTPEYNPNDAVNAPAPEQDVPHSGEAGIEYPLPRHDDGVDLRKVADDLPPASMENIQLTTDEIALVQAHRAQRTEEMQISGADTKRGLSKGAKIGAAVASLLVAAGAIFSVVKANEAPGSQPTAEQPAGDGHASGDILNNNQSNGTNNEVKPTFKKLESGKPDVKDQERYEYRVNGESMTFNQLISAYELKRDLMMTDEEFVANWAKSLELRINSASTDEEYAQYKDYKFLPPEKAAGSTRKGLVEVYEAVYRNPAQKATGLDGDGTKNTETGEAYEGTYRFFDTVVDELAHKQLTDFTAAKEAGKGGPHSKVTVISAKRETADEAANVKAGRAQDHVYTIVYKVDNGVGSTAFVGKGTFQFRPQKDSEQHDIWGYRDVRNEAHSAAQRSAAPSAPATLSVKK